MNRNLTFGMVLAIVIVMLMLLVLLESYGLQSLSYVMG